MDRTLDRQTTLPATPPRQSIRPGTRISRTGPSRPEGRRSPRRRPAVMPPGRLATPTVPPTRDGPLTRRTTLSPLVGRASPRPKTRSFGSRAGWTARAPPRGESDQPPPLVGTRTRPLARRRTSAPSGRGSACLRPAEKGSGERAGPSSRPTLDLPLRDLHYPRCILIG